MTRTKVGSYEITMEDGLPERLLPIDNNAAENAVRPLCVGRKNWLQDGFAERLLNSRIDELLPHRWQSPS